MNNLQYLLNLLIPILYAMVTTGRAPLCVWSATDFAENSCVGRTKVHVFPGTQEHASGHRRLFDMSNNSAFVFEST